MVHAVAIVQDVPLLHLAKGDVILVDLEDRDPVMLYRPLPLNYAAILPILVNEGAATTSLSPADLGCLAQLSEPREGGAWPGSRVRLVRE